MYARHAVQRDITPFDEAASHSVITSHGFVPKCESWRGLDLSAKKTCDANMTHTHTYTYIHI